MYDEHYIIFLVLVSIMSKWKERLKKTRAVLANNSNNLVIQGLESGFRDDYEQAIEDFDEALYGTLRTTETSINANFYKAVALVELDRKDEAIEIFKNISKELGQTKQKKLSSPKVRSYLGQ